MSDWRYLARRAVSGEFLDRDLPLTRDELTWTLSGAGSLRATVTPDVGGLRAADGRPLLEEWGTVLYAEADGELRWAGVVVSSRFEGGKWSIEAAGLSTYAHGLLFGGELTLVDADPADVVRAIWADLQGHPDGNLGVAVTGKTSAKVGTDAEPYELLWWNNPDAGKEIADLASAAPFDFVERVAWAGELPLHTLELADRHGRRREDLAFTDDNIAAAITPEINGDDYANEVVGLGNGEGRDALRSTVAVRDGRLRRTAVYTAKDVLDKKRLDALIDGELRYRANALEISTVVVRDHPNARIGSWQLGDDVLIDTVLPWLGRVQLWSRVVAWSLLSDTTASLSLIRSDYFRNGG